MEKWLSSKEFRKKYDISSATLWRRVHVGSVKTKQIFNTTYYLDESYNDDKTDNKLNIIYCRVSNTKQKDDLIRQEQLLKEFCVKKWNNSRLGNK